MKDLSRKTWKGNINCIVTGCERGMRNVRMTQTKASAGYTGSKMAGVGGSWSSGPYVPRKLVGIRDKRTGMICSGTGVSLQARTSWFKRHLHLQTIVALRSDAHIMKRKWFKWEVTACVVTSKRSLELCLRHLRWVTTETTTCNIKCREERKEAAEKDRKVGTAEM